MDEHRLLLAGYGKMGGALAEAWRKAKLFPEDTLRVVDPAAGNGTLAALDALHANWHPDIVLLAVKPQVMGDVLPQYAARFGTEPLYISIAAGLPLSFYTGKLGARARVIRAMPNTPAMVGKGMTVLTATASCSAAERKLAAQLFAACGEVAWLEDESLMHAVTALSGSGPAYAFLFMDALAEAAAAHGLEAGFARKLAEQTLAGSAALAAHSTHPLSELKRNVTSPGGTTEAALRVLEGANGLRELAQNAVSAAIKRSQELEK